VTLGAGVLLVLAATTQDPVVTAAVDRTSVMVGEVVTLTIRVQV
jgi:hypothetical protein